MTGVVLVGAMLLLIFGAEPVMRWVVDREIEIRERRKRERENG